MWPEDSEDGVSVEKTQLGWRVSGMLWLCQSGDLQVCRASIEVQVESLSADCDWAEVLGVILLWRGYYAAALDGSGDVAWDLLAIFGIGLCKQDSTGREWLGHAFTDREGLGGSAADGSSSGEGRDGQSQDSRNEGRHAFKACSNE